MSNHLFAAVDLGLVVVAALGLAIWQLVSVRRSLKRDRQSAENAKLPAP